MSESKTSMRGPTNVHPVDMRLKYVFMDRAGRYVYRVETQSAQVFMGTFRINWVNGECSYTPPGEGDEHVVS